MKINLKYNLKFYRINEVVKICSLWNSVLIWDFRSKGYIEFSIQNSFRDCEEKSLFENLIYKSETSFLLANILVFLLACAEILIARIKCWRNFMLFLKIKYKLQPKENHSYNDFYNSDNLSINSYTDSDILSINNNIAPKHDRNNLDYTYDPIKEENEVEINGKNHKKFDLNDFLF
jgi:hypothetical protein